MPKKPQRAESLKPRENILGENIRYLLKRQDQTVIGMAKAIGVSFKTAYHWTQGRNSPDSVSRQKLCDYFGITEAQLFSKGLSQGFTQTSEEDALIHALIKELGLAGVTPDDLKRLSDQQKTILKDLINEMTRHRSQQIQKIQAAKAGVAPGSDDHRKGILIVDDDPRLCRGLQVKLREIGYRAFVAGNGWEGMHQMEKHEPDLILLDMHIGSGMDGVEFLKKLREKDEKTKVIVISAFTGDVADAYAQGLRFEEHVTKPFDLEFVLERVEKYIGGPA